MQNEANALWPGCIARPKCFGILTGLAVSFSPPSGRGFTPAYGQDVELERFSRESAVLAIQLSSRPGAAAAELGREARQAQAMKKASHELTATVVGDPTVAAGMGLSLTGTHYFDQTYDVDTVHHEFGMRGHTTHITARSAAERRLEIDTASIRAP
jgi:hypothetical protein